MGDERVALLSVRPRFADALLDGSKTVEIRRRRAHIAKGSLCLVYASSPVRALIGAIRVRETDTGMPDVLWRRWGDQTGLAREEYDAYLVGSSQPCAIVIDAATRFTGPVTLPELRLRQDAFVTPQSYRFLQESELSSLMNGQARQLARLVEIGARPHATSSSRRQLPPPVVAAGNRRAPRSSAPASNQFGPALDKTHALS